MANSRCLLWLVVILVLKRHGRRATPVKHQKMGGHLGREEIRGHKKRRRVRASGATQIIVLVNVSSTSIWRWLMLVRLSGGRGGALARV